MLKVKKLHPDAKLPTRADSLSNGYDLYTVEDVFIPKGATAVINTGISVELPKFTEIYPLANKTLPFFEIKDRSSMAAKGLRTGAGVCDYGYTGPIKVVIHNLNNTDRYDVITENYGYTIKKGDRIAQGVITLSMTPDIEEMQELHVTERDNKSFGSSGR